MIQSEKEKEKVIRVVKKARGHGGGGHGGAWKVAYADFVTAMMALFIVLWIVGQSKQVKEYVAHYFKDPGAFDTTKGGILPGQNQPEVTPRDTSIVEQMKIQRQRLQKMANNITKEMQKSPSLSKVSKQIDLQITSEGLRVELMETPESFFFEIGTANIKEERKKVLELIAQEISPLPNHIVIEGHTDARPYPSPTGYTNFELSADRANSARRVMIAAGLHPAQVDEVRGYADTRLRNKDDPYDASNRRISILIKYEELQEKLGIS